jgi:hypothetical protein
MQGTPAPHHGPGLFLSDPSGPDRRASVLRDRFHRALVAFYDPVPDIANAQMAGIIDVELRGLPLIVPVCLIPAGNLHVQLLDAEPVLAGYGYAVGTTLSADSAET